MMAIKLKESRYGYYEVVEDYKFLRWTVPRGFLSNGVTIPSWVPERVRNKVNNIEAKYMTAAVIHDYLYYKQAGKLRADLVFLCVMLRMGTNIFTAVLFYLAVSLFGWHYY